jgi:hypothetical protein
MSLVIEAVTARHYFGYNEYFEMVGERKILVDNTVVNKLGPGAPFRLLDMESGGVAVVLNPEMVGTVFFGEMDRTNRDIFRPACLAAYVEGDTAPLLQLRNPNAAILGILRQPEMNIYEAEIVRYEADVPENRV